MRQVTDFPDDALVLCANEGLARELRARYALAMREAGARAWRVPQVLTLEAWVEAQWLALARSERLLRRFEALVLFHEAVARGGDVSPLAQRALARRALEAVEIAARWEIDLDAIADAVALQPEGAAFLRWRAAVVGRCAEAGWMPPWAALGVVTAALADGRLAPPRAFTLTGWARPPAAVTALAAALRRAGAKPLALPERAPARPRLMRFGAAEEQAYAVAELVRRKVLLHNGRIRIGIVVPDPVRGAGLIERALTDVLAPYLRLPCVPRRASGTRWAVPILERTRAVPWRHARGTPLGDEPIADAVVRVAQLREAPMPFSALSALLLHPYLFEGHGLGVRARAEAWLRGRTAVTIRLRDAARRLAAAGDADLAAFGVALAHLADVIAADEGARRLPSAWVERLRLRLEAAGWCGEHGVGSRDYQAVRRIDERLDRVAALDALLGEVDVAAAASWVREAVATALFRPRADHEQPVEILGLDEVAGRRFDAVFCVDASAQVLPAPAAPHPFIPQGVQVEAGVDEASPALAMAAATARLDALCRAGDAVTVSCPAAAENGTALLPTPLVDWSGAEPSRIRVRAPARLMSAEQPPLVVPRRDPVPPFDPARERLHGGVGLLEAVQEAPFVAFARHRLGAAPLPDPLRETMGAAAQNVRLHRVLELFWRRVRSQAALAALDEAALRVIVREVVAATIDEAAAEGALGDKRLLVEAECLRLERLLEEWLEVERRRPEPFEVVACEHETEVEIAGHRLAVRIDRIDRVGELETHHLLIDYKGGQRVRFGGWLGETLHEPQLPAYAACADLSRLGIAQVDGIAIAHVYPERCTLGGCTRWTETLDGSRRRGTTPVRDWEGLLARWGERLNEAMARFLAGEAWIAWDAPARRAWRDVEPLVRRGGLAA